MEIGELLTGLSSEKIFRCACLNSFGLLILTGISSLTSAGKLLILDGYCFGVDSCFSCLVSVGLAPFECLFLLTISYF